MHQSVATINSPEFLNLQPLDINPLMSKCEIKVLYLGANRNNSFITKEVATEMGKTLRGAPIVGYYKDSKEDFADHGDQMIFDDEGIHFNCLTKPYGFVAPDAQVWFQDFEDKDSFGNSIVRTYLMTTGYLWTGQFPESSLAVDEGRPQSMQLDRNTLEGTWQTNLKTGIDFFIINDAIVSKLCILGDDVEPCFEGASVTAPDVSSKFTLDNDFRHTLYSMMQDLKNALEGGQQMQDPKTVEVVEETESPANEVVEENPVIENSSTNQDKVNENTPSNIDNNIEDTTVTTEDTFAEKTEENTNTELQEKYAAIETEFNKLKESYTALQTQCEELTARCNELAEFKKTIDNEKKDALIADFYMLSNEDKADIIANKEKYSLEDIKAKLSVICFDKKVSFSKNEEKEKDENVVTYNVNNTNDSNLPDWVKAVKQQQDNAN